MTEEARKILEILPHLLQEDPQFRARLREVLATDFSTREDLQQSLDRIDRMLAESARNSEATERRFEASERHFETLLRSFEEHRAEDRQRFEAVDQSYEAQRAETLQKFEAADRRFETILAEIKDLRESSERRFQASERRFDDQQSWVGTVVGGFQVRAGRSLEDAIAGTLRIALKMTDVDPGKITLRRKVPDPSGTIGPPGRTYEVDIVVTNGETWIFEVKSVPDEEDIDRFSDKADLAIRELALPGARKALITLAKSPEVRDHCRRMGIELG